MTGPVRSHRRGTPVADLFWIGGLIAGGLLAIFLVRVALAALGDLTDGVGCLALVAVALGVWAARAWSRRRRHRRAVRELAGWTGTGGWEPALPRPWPWQDLVRWPDTVTVLRAYRKRVEGFAVVTGELAFTENGLGATVDRRDGHAAFAVVSLPQPAPSMAVRLHRTPARPRRGEDEFRRRFVVVGAGSPGPALRDAHVRDEVPPWTLRGDELFAFVPLDGPLRPGDLEQTARRTIHVLRLLGPLPPVEVGEDG